MAVTPKRIKLTWDGSDEAATYRGSFVLAAELLFFDLTREDFRSTVIDRLIRDGVPQVGGIEDNFYTAVGRNGDDVATWMVFINGTNLSTLTRASSEWAILLRDEINTQIVIQNITLIDQTASTSSQRKCWRDIALYGADSILTEAIAFMTFD